MSRAGERPRQEELEVQVEEDLLVFTAAELISRLMEERDVNKKQLAERLGKSRPFITQLLSGGRNLTLRTIARVAYALGYRLRLSLEPIGMQQMRMSGTKTPKVVSWVTKCEFQPPFESDRTRDAGEASDQSLAA